MTVIQRSRLGASATHRETFAQLQIASAVLSRSRDLHPPLILREPQHERPRPHRERLCKGLINGGGKDYPALPLGSGSGGGMTRDTHPSPSRHASAYLRFPLRERGGTAWPRSTLRSSRGELSAWLPPRRIYDRVSGPKSSLCEDFIEMEKGIGNLEEVCEGASPRSLAEPRDDSYTKVTPRRICDGVSGPARTLDSGSGAGMTV